MRPATLDLHVYVGEPRVYRLTFVKPDETPLALSGQWAAQARHNPAAKDAVDIDVNTTEMATGVLTLTIPGAALPNRSARWVWDLEGETWGTVLAGALIVSPEVTRVGETTGGSITDLVIALGPDEVRVVSSAQIGPRGLPGDDGREVELDTSATHVRWRYAGDAEWTDLVALADLAGEDGDDGTEVELGTSATHIQWRYVGSAWTDLVALADLKGEDGDDGIGVPDPAGQDADLVPITDGAGAYSLGERGITQQAADAAYGLPEGGARVGATEDEAFADANPGILWLIVEAVVVDPPASAPANLAATVISDTRIDLAWDGLTGVTSYEYRVDGGTPVDTGLITVAQVTGLAAGTAYDFEVRALNDGGPGPWSAVVSATTEAGPTAPDAPANLSAVGGYDRVYLAWSPSTGDVDGHRVYRHTANDFAGAVQVGGDLGAFIGSYVDTTTVNDTPYFYWVVAFNSVGESAPSTGASATSLADLSASADMLLTVDTTQEAGLTVTLPFRGTVNVTVDWGDGTAPESTTTAANLDHTYAAEGTYNIVISGSLTSFGSRGTNYPNAAKLVACRSFGMGLGLTELFSTFRFARVRLVPSALPTTVTNIKDMFRAAPIFNHPVVAEWNTGNVTNMESTFRTAAAFNRDISAWDTSKVTTMASMFEGATAFDQDLGGWVVTSVSLFTQMFRFVTLSTLNYDALLIGWSQQAVITNRTFDGGLSKYSSLNGLPARNVLTTNKGWTITDGGVDD